MIEPTRAAYSGRPRLEDDIEVIEEFDRFRERADQLRRSGIESLCRIVCQKASTAEQRRWVDETTEEPQDLIHPALVHLAVTRQFVSTTDVKHLVDEVCEKTKGQLKKAKLDQFFRSVPNTASCVPIFQAARVLRASLASPDTIFSKQAALAHYRVVRELASVDDGNWIFGGARATEGGVSSAFMTGECARAISALARALSSSASIVESVLKLFQAWTHLVSLAEFNYPIDSNFPTVKYPKRSDMPKGSYMPKEWIRVEANRLAFSAYNEIANVAAHAGICLEKEDYAELCDVKKDNAIFDFCVLFCNNFLESAKNATDGIEEAFEEILHHHRKEKANKAKDPVGKARLKFGHVTAKISIARALKLAKEAVNAAEEMRRFINVDHKVRPNIPAPLEDFVAALRNEADQTRSLLATTTIYLESVLDREIERESTGQFNAGELVSAAASYAELERPELDRRLERATEIICRAIGMDGSFATSTTLDTNFHGYSAVVIGSELLRSFAQLLKRNRFEVEPDTVKRILSYFERTAVRLPNGTIVGWSSDQPRYPVRASRWTSALAILALDRITRMLDDRINRRIFRHFSVKRPSDLQGKPPLNELFYSDYGLATQPESDADRDHYSGSVAYLLERMRSHLLGLAPPPGYNERCHSLLLFGPPGTGKTQLVESLAASCKTHFVEITPSDFLVEGEAFVERQARNVFRCLSYLTKTVILFDEFDPMIRSRELGQDKSKLDAFTFLTPGMLPKLKLLNDRAKQRRVAYCLITNHVDTLDEAAIRTGRFDFRVGIYPPDLLSRVGRLFLVVDQACTRDGVVPSAHYLKRVIDVLRDTAGGGMTLLGRPGNFTLPKHPISELGTNHVLKYLLDQDLKAPRYQPGKPDANLPKKAAEHRNPEYILELEQWFWVNQWDEAYKSKGEANALDKDYVATDLERLMAQWSSSYQVLDERPLKDDVRAKVAELTRDATGEPTADVPSSIADSPSTSSRSAMGIADSIAEAEKKEREKEADASKPLKAMEGENKERLTISDFVI